MFRIYTDGSCKGKPVPGRGGWAYIVKDDDNASFIKKKSGSASNTTNNRMELMAVISGLKSLPRENPAILEVEIVTDSTYVIAVATTNKPIEKLMNPDLVEELWDSLVGLKFHFTHVLGHSGHPENEMVDKMASSAAFKADWIGDK